MDRTLFRAKFRQKISGSEKPLGKDRIPLGPGALTANFLPRTPGLTPAFYIAPFPDKTAGMVFNKILRSSQSDQLSMYSRSSFTQS